jgi:LysR family transcriptional regulator, glycine cleavage system transcriptional activator
MKRYLPPLNSLRAFEAAARHCSFRHAADELHVSHSAISHQIKLLESQLSVELFHRSVRAVELTDAGRIYYPILRDAFDRIADGTERVRGGRSSSVLNVQVYVTFAVGWLIPRLIDFQKKHPEIQVHIDTSHIDADFQRSNADISVMMGYETQKDVHYEYLFTSDIYPVCSPELIKEGGKLKKPADLLKHNLLYIDHAEDDWPNWFNAAGIDTEGVDFTKGIRFNSYMLALDAAIDCAGVAIAVRPFGMKDIRAGRLVQPFEVSAKAYGDWYLAYRDNRSDSQKVIAFQKWIIEQIQNDPDITNKSQKNADA